MATQRRSQPGPRHTDAVVEAHSQMLDPLPVRRWPSRHVTAPTPVDAGRYLDATVEFVDGGLDTHIGNQSSDSANLPRGPRRGVSRRGLDWYLRRGGVTNDRL